MRLKLPTLGTPYVGASLTWRLMRWLIPIAIVGVSLFFALYPKLMDPKPTFGIYTPPSVAEIAVTLFFLTVIPTVFLYRLAIFIGERFWTRNPVHGAIAVAAAVALVLPFVSGLFVQRTINNLEFMSPSSSPSSSLKGKIVLLDDEGSFPYCTEYCLKLLYSSKVKAVIIEIPENFNGRTHAKNFEIYRLGVAPDCNYDWYRGSANMSFKAFESWPATTTAMGQIVAGNCIINDQSDTAKADFLFQPRWSIIRYNPQDSSKSNLQSMPTYGIIEAGFTSLFKLENGQKIEVLRVNRRYVMKIVRYPFTLTYQRLSFVAHDYAYGRSDQNSDELVKFGLGDGKPDVIEMEKSEALVLNLIQNTERPLSQAEKYFVNHYALRMREGGLTNAEIEQIHMIDTDGRAK